MVEPTVLSGSSPNEAGSNRVSNDPRATLFAGKKIYYKANRKQILFFYAGWFSTSVGFFMTVL